MSYAVQDAIVLICLHPRFDAVERERHESGQDTGATSRDLRAVPHRQPRRALAPVLDHSLEVASRQVHIDDGDHLPAPSPVVRLARELGAWPTRKERDVRRDEDSRLVDCPCRGKLFRRSISGFAKSVARG